MSISFDPRTDNDAYADTVIAGFAPSSTMDAFGRLRVSNPQTVFETSFPSGIITTRFDTSVTSSGTVTHDTNKRAAILTCTTTTGSRAILQSRSAVKYYPGKSQLCQFTGNLKGAATSVTKRYGFFDENNGLFFQLVGSTLSAVRRSKISGSVVDTAVNQADWNVDKLDGTGVSGKTLDTTKQQIFVIDYQWLGSGRVRYGFSIDGQLRICHEMYHANLLDVMYMQTAMLPLRAEITNAGSTTSTMEITCAAVMSEGGYTEAGELRSASTGHTARSIGTSGTTLPLISIRKNSTYVTNPVKVLQYGVFVASLDEVVVRLVHNPTLTGASWTSIGTATEADISATSYTGGTILDTHYVQGGSGSAIITESMLQYAQNFSLGSTIAGASDIITIAVTAITSSVSTYGMINLIESV